MPKKIIIIILSIYLLYILGQAFFKLFELDVEVISSEKRWAKVLNIETHKTKSRVRGIDLGESTTWLIKVKIKDKTPLVYLSVGPPPKIGQCIPVITNELSNGNIIASMNNQEWRYGTIFGNCN